VGELVIRSPWIGMTRGFWKDRARYMDTYWSRWPDTWVHGDFAAVDSDGLWYILGRSDDTIKLAGKRVGPAEIEAALMATGLVADAAVVGIPDDLTGSALLCVCVAIGEAGPALARRMADVVARDFGAPFRPRHVVFVSDLPKTRNQKIMRRVVRSLATHRPTGDLTSLANPEVVEELQRVFAGLGQAPSISRQPATDS